MTFDIEGIDMEYVSGGLLKCPEDDSLFTDYEEDYLSDYTLVGGIPWHKVRVSYFYEPNFDRRNLYNSLNSTDQ